MKFSALALLFTSLVFSAHLMAEQPLTKEEQCAQYGSYQDEEGNWQTCSEEDMPTEESE